VKGLHEQNHYEILDVAREASADVVEHAYRVVRDAFAEDSLAIRGVYDNREAAAMRSSADEAFRVLSDPDARAAYDLELQAAEVARTTEGALEAEPTPGWEVSHDEDGEPKFPSESIFDLESTETTELWDGPQLKRFRLQRGVDLDEVVAVTKVNPLYLRAIEEERFQELPAEVYVRGFLIAYARFFELPAEPILSSFLKRLREAQGTAESTRRHWLRGRRA